MVFEEAQRHVILSEAKNLKFLFSIAFRSSRIPSATISAMR
jgi:hypothetical protein